MASSRTGSKGNAAVRTHDALEVELSALAFAVPGVHIARCNESTLSFPTQRQIFVKPDLFRSSPPELVGQSHYQSATMRQRRRFLVKECEEKRSKRARSVGSTQLNFADIVDIDDEAFENYVSIELAGRLVEGGPFRIVILIIIILNSILIGIQTDRSLERHYSAILTAADRCFLTIFIMEIALKWYYGFVIFWKLGWNVFDFAIVAASLLGPSITFLSSGRVLRILRVLRAFRTLRSISALNGLQIIVQTVLQSIPDMTNIILLLMIIMFIFSVVGVTVFRESMPESFEGLGTAMFSLFVCITQDGWFAIYVEAEKAGMEIPTAIYLAIFITVGAFIFANLVVAVVVTNLELAFHEIKESTKRLNRDLKTDYDTGMFPSVVTIDTSAVLHDVARMQEPLELPDFNEMVLSAGKLENYSLVLSSIEDNLFEFVALKKKLHRIFTVVHDLNKDVQEAYEAFDEYDSEVPEVESVADDFLPSELRNQEKNVGGDIMSEMMKLQGHGSLRKQSKTWSSVTNLIKSAKYD